MSNIEVQQTLPDEVDVIVVGSGAAALAGAYTAAAKGMQVLVLEKMPLVGGITSYSGGAVWLPGNAALARDGVVDNVEDGLTYFRATVGGRTPSDLQEAYVRTGPELLDFLESNPVIRFESHPFPDYFEAPGRARPTGRTIRPVPLACAELGLRLDLIRGQTPEDSFGVHDDRTLFDGGHALIGRLVLALDSTGNADIRVSSPMTSLVVTDGAVTGVRVGDDGHEVRARAGVLLAAGGFECDAERRREFQGLPGAEWASSPAGSNTGDALTVLESVGASIDLLDESWWCPSILFPNGRAAFAVIISGGIFVGPDGKRFTNESLPYDRLGHEIRDHLREHGSEAELWWVFDSNTPNIPGYCAAPVDEDEFRSAGIWRSGATVRELAEALDVDAAALSETIERYNEFARTGVDPDFHRGEDDYDRFFALGTGPNPALVPVSEGEFRAVRIVLGDIGTKGGARIDTSARVLDRDGAPIPGLYAAGGSSASVAGHVYPGPGVPIGSGMVFGYRAARAMQEALQTVQTTR
ncbi:FAD-dependent oxidoreductase [Rhodococcus sp. NPDC003322]